MLKTLAYEQKFRITDLHLIHSDAFQTITKQKAFEISN